MKTKNLLSIIGLVAVVIIVISWAGLYRLEPSSPSSLSGENFGPTPSMRIYNTAYGISFKYPVDWIIQATSTSNITNLALEKDGYSLMFQICDRSQSCYKYEPGILEVSPNTELASPIRLSLDVGGHQAWRTITPALGGMDSDALYFDFIFLYSTASTTDMSGFNDRSKYTPTEESIKVNGIYYRINYFLPPSATKTSYDRSLVSQMDDVIQSTVFSKS